MPTWVVLVCGKMSEPSKGHYKENVKVFYLAKSWNFLSFFIFSSIKTFVTYELFGVFTVILRRNENSNWYKCESSVWLNWIQKGFEVKPFEMGKKWKKRVKMCASTCSWIESRIVVGPGPGSDGGVVHPVNVDLQVFIWIHLDHVLWIHAVQQVLDLVELNVGEYVQLNTLGPPFNQVLVKVNHTALGSDPFTCCLLLLIFGVWEVNDLRGVVGLGLVRRKVIVLVIILITPNVTLIQIDAAVESCS